MARAATLDLLGDTSGAAAIVERHVRSVVGVPGQRANSIDADRYAPESYEVSKCQALPMGISTSARPLPIG